MALALSICLLWVVVTILGDVVHALLHASLESSGPLRWPGLLHRAHHRFLDEQLAFHDERFWRNVAFHQLPELLMRSSLAAAVGAAAGLSGAVVVAVVGLFAFECGAALWRRGRDRFHQTQRPVGPPASGLFVDAAYHAHHHAFPGHFLSAHLQVVDRVLGWLLPLHGRAVVVVGGSRFCADIADALAGAGARVERQADDGIDIAAVAAADIVVLGHGAWRRDHAAYEAIVGAALTERASPLPLEVWAVGDDAGWAARRDLFADRAVLRVLRRAPVLGAATTLFWLRRGVRVL